MTTSEICIAGRKIGDHHPPYIIAEISANHNGSLEHALAIMQAAKDAGADAVKLQTYTADTITIDHDSDQFRITGGLWHNRTLYDLYEEGHMPWEWHKPLFDRGRELGLTVFSSPFDFTSIDFLEDLNAPAYKIASFEAIDLPLIKRAAQTGKPLIISTGMATEHEIFEAVTSAQDAGCKQLVLLHCVSGYPAPAEDSHLRTIQDMQNRYNLPIGLSDHTLGTSVAIAAAALGSVVIEKHFTLSRADGGPDSAFSLEPSELKALCSDTKTAWSALGEVNYERKASEESNIQYRRSLYVIKDIKAGEKLTAQNIRSIRPGYGLEPKHYEAILKKRAKSDINRGTALNWSLID